MELANTTQKFYFPFSQLKNGPFRFKWTPENSANIWQIKKKWNEIDEVWNSVNLLFK